MYSIRILRVISVLLVAGMQKKVEHFLRRVEGVLHTFLERTLFTGGGRVLLTRMFFYWGGASY